MSNDFADRLVAARSPRRETKSLIYRHALRLFARHGYAGTSLREIAEAVGLEVPSLYTHIRSKRELLYDLMEFGNRDLLDRLARSVAAVPDDRPLDRLYLLVRENVISHCRHSDQTTVVFTEIRELSDDQRAKIVALRREIENLFRSALEAAVAEGVARPVNIAVTVFGALAIGRGAATWYRENGPLSPEEIGDLYGEQVVRGVLAPGSDWSSPGA
ncbi:TetR/AcrR family transcriptional regulator [Pseudonocardia zijingensis]|uniref:TetR/AcrR family transcriptional regulator n=1 Tax=Pseudonocardia zijingensis TaxID=153376 RepID=A0ABN1Q0B0_9PSEU